MVTGAKLTMCSGKRRTTARLVEEMGVGEGAKVEKWKKRKEGNAETREGRIGKTWG